MKKKQIFSLLMLCSYNTFIICDETTTVAVTVGAAAHQAHKRKKTNFKELEFIKMVDGKYGMFDGYSILESKRALFEINKIQYGKKDKTTHTRTGSYKHGQKIVNLQEIVMEERKLIKEQVAKNDAQWTQLNTTLSEIKDDFNAKMKKLRGEKEENDMAKNIKHKLITFFLKDQNREVSLMANSDLPDEKKRLYDASAAEFFAFLNDLSHFLEDMADSCPVALKQYEELKKKTHN